MAYSQDKVGFVDFNSARPDGVWVTFESDRAYESSSSPGKYSRWVFVDGEKKNLFIPKEFNAELTRIGVQQGDKLRINNYKQNGVWVYEIIEKHAGGSGPIEESLPSVSEPKSTPVKATTPQSSDKMSKEEWSEKDKRDYRHKCIYDVVNLWNADKVKPSDGETGLQMLDRIGGKIFSLVWKGYSCEQDEAKLKLIDKIVKRFDFTDMNDVARSKIENEMKDAVSDFYGEPTDFVLDDGATKELLKHDIGAIKRVLDYYEER